MTIREQLFLFSFQIPQRNKIAHVVGQFDLTLQNVWALANWKILKEKIFKCILNGNCHNNVE